MFAELFLVFESSYYAYKGGLLSGLSWNKKRETIVELLENPILSEWWASRMTPFSEEFWLEIESRRGSAGSWVHQAVSGSPRPAA
jgi:hypothetical protein